MSKHHQRTTGAATTERFRTAVSLHAIAACRDRVGSFLRSHGADDELVEDARLVVSELGSNVARHTDLDDAEVGVSVTPDSFVIEMSGAPVARDRPVDSPPTTQRGGRGLIIVAAIAERVDYVDRGDDRFTRVVLRRTDG